MSSTKNKDKVLVSFSAIDPWLERNIVSPAETPVHGKDYVQWGDNNSYPDYLLELSKTVPTLRSIIQGTVDFITGDNVTILPLNKDWAPGQMNLRGDTIAEQVEDLARDYETYGGFALQVIRGFDGSVVEVYYIDIRFLRMNKEGEVFYYSEKWAERGSQKAVVYPAFRADIGEKWDTMDEDERNRNASSILYVKNTHSQVYPLPVYAASVKACEIERLVDDYHLNSLSNGFASSLIVNFNNGQPTDDMKEEIEREFDEKFTGSGNAGRVMFSWNKSKDNATTFEVPPVTDFGEKYKALAENSRQKIFTAFRAYPNLFGLSTSTGFNIEEFEQAFKLYNRTAVRPVQRKIADAYERIYGLPGVLTITPFSLGGETEQTVN
jgi:capsid portal protein